MTNATSTHQTDTNAEIAERGKFFRRWLDQNSHTNASEKALARMPWPLRLALRLIYAAGVLGLGWATYDLLLHKGGFPPFAAIGVTVILDTFVLVSAFYYVRARLRGNTSWHKGGVVVLGVLASAALQIAFHGEDQPVRAAAVSVAGLLSLISWLLSVNDEHAAVFEAQAEAKRARRVARREARKATLAYAYANGARATVREWKGRTVAVGGAERRVDTTLAVQAQQARLNVVRGELLDDAPVSPVAPRLGPFPPAKGVGGRPVSSPPSMTVIGDDEHADALRALPSATAGVAYAVEKFPTWGGAEIRTWLVQYGIYLDPSTVRGARLKALRALEASPSLDGKRDANA